MSMHHTFMKIILNPHLEYSSSNLDFIPKIFNVPGGTSSRKGKEIAET